MDDRKKGMLWGLVVGDCLGSPIQFTAKDGHPHIEEMVPCRHFRTPPGYWTDDSSMAFCIMESVVRLGRYDLRDIANNFVRWYDKGFWSSLSYAFDVGTATATACIAIRDHGSLCNGFEESQGNGSIMRFAPTYFLNGNDTDNRIPHEISDLTHASKTIRKTVDLMMEICTAHLNGKRTEHLSEYSTREEVNNSGWAVSTVQAALWAFHSTRTFEDGMIAAVNLGGDADSIGAVYGQIAGAYYGFSAIPERWLQAIKDRDKIEKLITDFLDCLMYNMVIPAEVGFSLEFEEAKKKLEELNKEYASLLTEYDELTGTVRVNLETEYMMQIGRKEHQLFSLQIQVQQLKREIDLYQAAKNQGETMSPDAVREIIEREFAEYKAKLAEQQKKIEQAETFHFAKKLPSADSKALKDLYYDLVKKLHPDLNPNLPPKAKMLWLKIVEAYKSWDWKELNVLADMAYDLLDRKEIQIKELSSMDAVVEQQKKVSEKIAAIRAKMEDLRSRPPFTYEKLLSSQKAVNEKRKELDGYRAQYEEHIQQLTVMRDELRGRK